MDAEVLKRFVREAGFIFRGTALAQQPAERPVVPVGAGEVAAVHIEAVLRSAEALRSLAGREAFVVTRETAALHEPRAYIFFVEVLSLGRQLLAREIGRVEAGGETWRQVVDAIQQEDERPLHERAAAAELIVIGEVVESRALERPFPPPSEHWPDWGIARVAVSAVLKGDKPQGDVEVLFAASLDRVWFHAPKLHRGVAGILLLFRADPDERPPKELPHTAYQALDPLDLQPINRRGEIERLIGGDRGEH